MEKKTASAIMLTLLLASIIALAFRIQLVRAEPKVISVPTDYSTIQAAIYAANPGDTIFVYNGTYYENVVVNKNDLTLIGQNRSNTVIDGKETGSVIIISASNVIIKEFTVRNSAAHQSGIYIGWSLTGNVVRNNIITSNYCGISILVSNSITVADNSITNNKFGFYIVQSSDNNVIGNIITDNEKGVWLDWSNLNTIANNSIAKNSVFGIGLYRSSGNTIRRNALVNNSVGVTLFGGAGIFSNDNVIYHNNFINNTSQVQSEESINFWDRCYPAGGNYWSDYPGVDADGDGISDAPYVIDSDNQDCYPLVHPWSPLPVHNINTGLGYATIQEAINANETLNGHTIFVEAGTYYEHVVLNKSLSLIGEHRSLTTIDGSGMGTAVTVSHDNINLWGFTIQNSGFPNAGIQLNNVSRCNLFLNSIKNNWFNLDLYSSSNNSLNENNIGNGYYGIKLHDSSNHNSISANSIAKNEWGIHLANSINNTIYGNNIAENNWGIELQYSSNNSISGNNVTANMAHGIWLGRSPNNHISRNNITNNSDGVGLYESSNNIFHHNNFIDNTQQIYFLTSGYTNFWDDGYPSGGNYWSDYVGVDVEMGPNQDLPGSDGLGDTPYIIDASNTDHYPLMNPYGAPPLPTYTLTITTTVGGTTDPAPGTYGYTANSAVQVTAIPAANYLFEYWELDSVNVGSANPYSVLMDKNHALKAVFALIPPPLSVSINPLSASILVGQSVTFTSTVSGGYTPYTYQWYLNGNPVSGATSNTWTFTPTTSGIYYVHLKVTDAKANTAQSDAARIAVATVPVGGYSFSIQVQTGAEPIIPYIALIATLTAVFTKLRPKTKRKR